MTLRAVEDGVVDLHMSEVNWGYELMISVDGDWYTKKANYLTREEAEHELKVLLEKGVKLESSKWSCME